MGGSMVLAILFLLVASMAMMECKKLHVTDLPPKKYNTAGGPKDGVLNVHLVCHTHDDVGWLKTVDQYYMGSNNSIQFAGVQYILDSVVQALQDNPDRKFIYVEQAFFQRWWRQQTDEKQAVVRSLVDLGQLEFINGGWCMHDEATTHFIDMIDQTTLGHRYILDQFGKRPRIAWQIDPFGHSSTQGALLTAEAGFDAVFFGRADFADIDQRRKDKKMEVVWRPSESLGASAETFAGILSHHYSPPNTFDFDIYSRHPPIQDDPRLFDVNVEERVNAFIADNLKQAEGFRTNNILLTMGNDFVYMDANTWFKNLDKLIHYVNKNGSVNVFYSTPSIYVDAKHRENITWPLKEDDYFPYSDCPHCFWTGFFTSRPTIKGYVRKMSALLQAARQLELFVGRDESGATTDLLEESVAIAQHHDAVAGTEKQHVADDYAKRLAMGGNEAEEVVANALAALVTSGGPSPGRMEALRGRRGTPPDALDAVGAHLNLFTSPRSQARALMQRRQPPGHPAAPGGKGEEQPGVGRRAEGTEEGPIAALGGEEREREAGWQGESPQLEQCQLLNISYCPPTEAPVGDGEALVVLAYNPLAWFRTELVRIPVSNQHLKVSNARGKTLLSQVTPLVHLTHRLRAHHVPSSQSSNETLYELAFHAHVPPLGYATFFVEAASPSEAGCAVLSVEESVSVDPNDLLHITNERAGAVFSPVTGRLVELTNEERGITVTTVDQTLAWYNASDGNTDEDRWQADGAYIFRPNSSESFPIWKAGGEAGLAAPRLSIVRGPLYQQVTQEFAPWASQVFRLVKESASTEVDFTIGPIPIEDSLGKDVVTRFSTKVKNGRTFYTDSNGMEMQKRVVDHRETWNLTVYEPVAGNYYPVNSAIFIRDEEAQVTLLTDRAVGATSLREGELEVMLHRRLLYDDARGVGEALNETTCCRETCQGLVVRGTFQLGVGRPSEAASWHRPAALRIVFPLQLAFTRLPSGGPSTWLHHRLGTFSALKPGVRLPPNVGLITLQELPDGTALLRLAHLFQVGEDERYSQKTTVDLGSLFAAIKVTGAVELNLSGNQKRTDVSTLKWRVDDGAENKNGACQRSKPLEAGSLLVDLHPMEIRTFSVQFTR